MPPAWPFALALLLAGPAHAARIQEARPLMGTVVEIVAEGPGEAALRAAVENAYREMHSSDG
jgi:hypothetical protein